MAKVSIIVPTFNSGATIQRCLQSIAAQGFTDYEVIVQDGSPDDNTAREVERFKEKYVRIAVRHFRERDLGPYDAMNKAMAKACGEWLYFLGGDDELIDDRVLGTILTGECTSGCDVIYGSVQSVGDSVWGKSGTKYDGGYTRLVDDVDTTLMPASRSRR